jgi:hypothetical protein
MITRGRRTEFTGAHLDPRTKDLVRYLLRRQARALTNKSPKEVIADPSLSQFVSEAVEEKLARELTPEYVNEAILRKHLRTLQGTAA